MRPEEIALIVARRWWIIALAALVAGLIGFVGTDRQPKTYSVSARIMAIADPPDYWMDLYAKNRLVSYKDLINNYQFVQNALAEAGSSIDPGLAQSKLTLGHSPDANTIQIVATDTDPARAAEIVNALADGFVAQSELDNQRIQAEPRPSTSAPPSIVNMLKLDTPGPPTTPSGPRVKVNTLAAAILGCVAGLIVVFGTIYFDDTLKKPADLDRYLELPLLASVSAGGIEREPGTSKFGSWRMSVATADRPAALSASDEGFRILRSTVKFAAGEQVTRSVLVVDIDPPAPSGVAARLAVSFAEAGERTIYLDAGTGSSAAQTAGLRELLDGSLSAADLLASAGSTQLLQVGPGTGLTPELLAGDALSVTVKAFVDSGAFVVVSCAPLPDHGDALSIAPRVDATILVVSAGRTRRARAVEARDALERVGARILGVTLVEGKKRWFW